MSDPRRVLTCYYRPKPGGLCRRLFRGMEALLERGHEVHYLAVDAFPVRHPACRFHRLPVPTRRRSGVWFGSWFVVAAPPALLYLALRHRVDRLFAFGALYGLLLQPARWWSRRPLTVFLRADAIANHRWAGRGRGARAVQGWVEGLGLAGARVLAVSQSLADTVSGRRRRLRPRWLGVLRNDVPPTPPRPASPAADPVPPYPVRAAAVGVVEARKNPALLVRALEEVEPDRLRLTFYGDGPALEELRRRVATAGLAEQIRFAGWRRPEEFWPEVDLLLMPSHHEGAPNAVLEALGRNIPVLASDLAEHREILPASALLPADDDSAWAARLAAISAGELDTLREEQRAAADALRFDWDGAFAAAVVCDPAEAAAKELGERWEGAC